jgi:predicted AAA+ superfamily ATPase
MFTRLLELPARSFFLLGPRGTGKTTWLGQVLPRARWYDLIRSRDLVRLSRDPDLFTREVQALRPGWIVVDEVQRLPTILNEIQHLISRHGKRYSFAVTGSSARKLRRGGANLLPARLVNRSFFPLTAAELDYDLDVDAWLKFGALPAVCDAARDRDRVDLLDAYVENYIAQEVRIEASVKNLDSFARFTSVAALMNAQVTNLAGIARDAAVPRPTVQGYFDTLVDTLLGVWLPAWRPRAKVKEIAHPKFYFFDAGVVRALTGRLREPLDSAERGPLFETAILHELRAWISLSGCGGELSYWRTPDGAEVDFIWRRADHTVAVEAKATPRWRSDESAAILDLAAHRNVKRCFGVYLGDRALKEGRLWVLPLRDFLRRLHAGDVLRA